MVKKDPKNLERRKEAARRLAIIAGQINAVKAMIENGRDCLDIATQSSAVLNALRGVNKIILRNFMDDYYKNKKTTEEAKDEVIDVLFKFIK
ncbi:MAG: metal-sensitive transcriptional regulator [Candidatus Marinimicrobia bacterium]|nr:metal-sensitive transcriptional regulator [Candidatus Neomarinimicrobiota bacterium]